MKTSILIMAAALLISLNFYGQEVKDLPAGVKTAFIQKFPNATGVKWGKENAKEWEAEFKMDGKDYSANFDNAGGWMETEYQVTVSELPAAVKATLDKESAGSKIKLSEVTETKDGKAFEFVLNKGENKTELVIDNSGKVTKMEQLKEENENDEKEDKEGN